MLMKDNRTLGKALPQSASPKKLVDARTVEDFYAKDKTNINFWLAKMEKYSKENVVSSCLRSGVDRKTADEIAAEVDSYVDNRMRMSEVRPLIFAMLQQKNPAAAKKFKAGEIYVRTSGQRFERFNRERIVSSLLKETKIAQPDADHIALEVEKFIRASNLDYVSSPLLREMANAKLIEHGFEEARSDYTRIGMPVFDITELINIGSNENANLQYNPETLHKLIADNVFKEYALMKAIPRHAADAHLHGLVHIHDLDYFVLRPFCFSHDLRYFFKKGYYADGQGIHTAAAGPPKHAEVAILHAAKILASAQTQCGGGQGYNWFNIFLAPFVRGFDYKKMKQMAQMFLFEMSQMYVARGGQTVFSSINLEPSVPKTLENIPAVLPGGITNGDTYGSYENEANQLFRAFIDVYTKGDAIGKPFNFPKCEVKVTAKDFDNHREEMDMVSALAAKFGTPYYFIQQDYMPEYACFQSLPFDEKVFVSVNDELKIVKIGEYVEELMEKQGIEKGKGLEGEVEVSEGSGFAISFNPETLDVEKRRIGKVMRHMTKEKIFRFVLDTNRRISATAKHKIHVLRGGKIIETRAEEIRKGDYFIGLKNLEMDFSFNDEIDFKNRKMKIDADFARLLGYFASEGCLHLADRKNRANKICFSFHEKETEFIEDVEKILKEKFGLNPKRDVSIKNKCITVYVCDKSIAELFALLGTGFDAHSKRVPEKILSAPREIIKEFMLGLFRGDGYFKSTDKRKIDLHLCNKALIEDAFALSLRIGIPMDLFEGKESFSLRLTSNKRINSFLADIPFAQCTKTDGGLVREFDFYDRMPSLPFEISRENMKIGHWNRAQIGKRITMGRLELSDNLFSRFAESDLHLFEVKKIEEVKSEYVYDFVDVDKYHNFANANGIFSSNCCAYMMPLSEQNTQDDLYNGTTRGGALQVVTINLPRIAYDAEGNDTKLFELLRERMKIAKDVLLVKQKIIKQRMQQGVLPFLSQVVDDKGTPYLDVDKQVLEIGMVGLNEMLKVHTGHELHEGGDAWKFGMKVIKTMTDIAKEFSAETGAKFVTSRTPAESCSYRLASIDLKEMNGKAVVQGDRAKKAVYYTNGNHVRPSADVPLFDRLRIEASFNPLLVGGTMSHVWMGEANPDPTALTSLTERIVKKTLMAYYAYTKDMTVCKSCKFVAPDLLKTCPHCNSKDIDWYSRITGYYQKVSGWNAGKLQELHDRRRYGVSS
ncbi:hypothetical protein D4Q76_01725 [archaeon]|nr:MAG: hypothetical protein D4Q76_01725 [archaeon]